MSYEANEARQAQPDLDVEKRTGKSLDGLNYQPSKGYMPTANPKTDETEQRTDRLP